MKQSIAYYYDDIFQFVQRRINNTEDAKDLTQDIFYKLSIAANDNRSWIYAVARHAIIDYYRKKKRPIDTIDDHLSLVDTAKELFPTWTEKEICSIKQYLHQLIDTLPSDYRQIIWRSEIQGMKQKDIATELGIPASTVRSKVQRGRKKLKAKITACCEIIQGGKGSLMGFKPKSKTELPTCNCSNEHAH
jgi:RNA polymerase sigma-70 factor (ECF subfamily)